MSAQPPELRLTVVSEGSPLVISAVGIMDIATAGHLEAVVGDELAEGRAVILDVAGVTMCDSTGLGSLVRLQRRAAECRSEFVLRGPGRHLTDVLQMTGISKILAITPADR
jgi:anti-anti-sigma factor